MPAAGLALLVVLAYLPLWQAGFVWDDDINITRNPNIRGGVAGLLRLWVGDTTDWYPLTWTLFWLEWQLWGDEAVPYHLVNLALHVLGALLVWLVLLRLSDAASARGGGLSPQGAWLGAAFFALQPVNVASVAWITEGKNTLSLVFAAACTLAWLRWDRSQRGYLLALLLYVAALLSKASVVPLPVVLAALTWWKRGGLEKRHLAGLLPYFLLSAAATRASLWFHSHRVLFGEDVRPEGFASRLAAAGKALWFYPQTELWPVDLPPIYPRWDVDPRNVLVWLPMVAAAAVVFAAWRWRERIGRGPLTAVICYVALVAPVLGLCDIYFMKYSLVADHWQYLASVVLMGALGALMSRLPQRALHAAGGLTLIAMIGLTLRQSDCYTSSETLWKTTVSRNPDAWVGWLNLGREAQRAGRPDEAMQNYDRCLQLRRDSALAHVLVGILLREKGKLDDAVAHYQAALDFRPDFAEGHYNLAIALRLKGRVEEAVTHYEKAIALEPAYIEARGNLAAALIETKRYKEAAGQAEEALRLRPGDPAMLFNLGMALEKQGALEEALARYHEALQVDPELALAMTRIAWIRATAPEDALRNGDEAAQLAAQACQATANRDPDALDALAAAQAERGKFKQAVDVAHIAAGLAGPELRREIEKRAALYNALLPYRTVSVRR